MATLTVRNLTFSYPMREKPALDNINLSFEQGELVLLCGRSGSGKTTLLRHFKAALMPAGNRTGGVYYIEDGAQNAVPIEKMDKRSMAARVGYVFQNPDNQIVTDKVWHELAFGLENLGMDNNTIRLRVSEMASFFGIQEWFEKDVRELSGGQKQLLSLASIMVMQPEVLVLDEPTSRLDPIASDDFMTMIKKINRELGVTVIMSEQRLETVFADADRVVVMDGGRVVSDSSPCDVGDVLGRALPASVRIYKELVKYSIGSEYKCPLNVREGRAWLNMIGENINIYKPETGEACRSLKTVKMLETVETHREAPCSKRNDNTAKSRTLSQKQIEVGNVWFRYEKKGKDILKGLSFEVNKGEIFAILGGNGSGKTTALKMIAARVKPYRGSVKINGGRVSLLAQDPQLMFSENTVSAELYAAAHERCRKSTELRGLSDSEMISEAWERVKMVSEKLALTDVLDSHPYDLSGGEQQKTALAIVLLDEPDIILLDEPTKGLDAEMKHDFGKILCGMKAEGKTIVLISHDMEFCAETADRCALMFGGSLTACGSTHEFFSGNSFYTTAANRMARHIYPSVVTAEDVISQVLADSGRHIADASGDKSGSVKNIEADGDTDGYSGGNIESGKGGSSADGGSIQDFDEYGGEDMCGDNDMIILETETANKKEKHMSKVRCIIFIIMAALFASAAFAGAYISDGRKYYFVSMMMVIFAMVPFAFVFERKKPRARELVMISVLSALCVTGRAAFFMLPSFKPTAALVMISGICLGPQSGFLIGAVSGFVSNFFFGQGPWTPWQMLAYAAVGLAAGISGLVVNWKHHRAALVLFGAFSAFFIYGGIVDIWTILGYYPEPSLKIALTVYGLALSFNAVHAAATALFLLIFGKPMIEKIERVKIKYGIVS